MHPCIARPDGPSIPCRGASSSRSKGKAPPAGARRPANHANEKHSQTRDISFRRSDVNRHCRTAHAVEEHGAESMFLGERTCRFLRLDGRSPAGNAVVMWGRKGRGKNSPGPLFLFRVWRRASGLGAGASDDFKYGPRGLNRQSPQLRRAQPSPKTTPSAATPGKLERRKEGARGIPSPAFRPLQAMTPTEPPGVHPHLDGPSA